MKNYLKEIYDIILSGFDSLWQLVIQQAKEKKTSSWINVLLVVKNHFDLCHLNLEMVSLSGVRSPYNMLLLIVMDVEHISS